MIGNGNVPTNYVNTSVAPHRYPYCELKCNKCGLFVLPTIPFLGATPDAVINDECIVEVKYPYGGKNEKIIPGEL
jgi:hypothetical protein